MDPNPENRLKSKEWIQIRKIDHYPKNGSKFKMDPNPENRLISKEWIQIRKMNQNPKNGSKSRKWTKIQNNEPKSKKWIKTYLKVVPICR